MIDKEGYSNYTNATGEFKAYSNQNGDFVLPLNASGAPKGIPESDIVAYYTIVIDNNLAGVKNALLNAGLGVPKTFNRTTAMATLWALYKQDKNKFLSVVKSVPYNQSATNYTTQPSFIAAVTKYTNELKS